MTIKSLYRTRTKQRQIVWCVCFYTFSPNLQISPFGLFSLDSLEQALEITRTEPIKVVALDDLNEYGRPIHQRLSEQLQEISALVEIDEDVKLLQGVEILLQLEVNLGRLQPEPHGLVVGVGDADEVDAALAEVGDGGDYVPSTERNMLHTGPVVKVDEFFDLGLLLAGGRLVDGHLDDFVGRSHYHRAEGGELRTDVGVVDRPETVEPKAFFVAMFCQ